MDDKEYKDALDSIMKEMHQLVKKTNQEAEKKLVDSFGKNLLTRLRKYGFILTDPLNNEYIKYRSPLAIHFILHLYQENGEHRILLSAEQEGIDAYFIPLVKFEDGEAYVPQYGKSIGKKLNDNELIDLIEAKVWER